MNRRVAIANWRSTDFHFFSDKVHDPQFGDTFASIKR